MEGGILWAMYSAASKLLLGIIEEILAGSGESEESKAKMFLGKRGRTYCIRYMGKELLIALAEASKLRGFYVKYQDRVYQGKEILHELFDKIPLLNCV